jgi:hypothetical protein
MTNIASLIPLVIIDDILFSLAIVAGTDLLVATSDFPEQVHF